MHHIDVEEIEKKELEEKRIYEACYENDYNKNRKAILFHTIKIGSVFIVIGILIFIFFSTKEKKFVKSGLFLFFGICVILGGIVAYNIYPKKGNYEQYKNQVDRDGSYNLFNLIATCNILSEKTKKLEEENLALRKILEESEQKDIKKEG